VPHPAEPRGQRRAPNCTRQPGRGIRRISQPRAFL